MAGGLNQLVHETTHRNAFSLAPCGPAHLSLSVSSQGRHVKTGQLAAIKVMDVTEVRQRGVLFQLDITT